MGYVASEWTGENFIGISMLKFINYEIFLKEASDWLATQSQATESHARNSLLTDMDFDMNFN